MSASKLKCRTPIANCVVYKSSNEALCETCKIGYGPLADFTGCRKLVEGCTAYDATNVNECTTCGAGLTKTTNKLICRPAIPNCKTYVENSLLCSACNTDYVLKDSGKYCSSSSNLCSIQGCKTCINSNVTCDECETSLSLSFSKTSCVSCSVTGCQSCDRDNSCRVCNAGKRPTLEGDVVKCYKCDVANC